jgi:hypothetical protein
MPIQKWPQALVNGFLATSISSPHISKGLSLSQPSGLTLHQATICFFTEIWHKADLSLETEFGDKELAVERVRAQSSLQQNEIWSRVLARLLLSSSRWHGLSWGRHLINFEFLVAVDFLWLGYLACCVSLLESIQRYCHKTLEQSVSIGTSVHDARLDTLNCISVLLAFKVLISFLYFFLGSTRAPMRACLSFRPNSRPGPLAWNIRPDCLTSGWSQSPCDSVWAELILQSDSRFRL